MLAGRPGLRFALEALFLILLAVGAGLADLRPLVIVLVMAGAWVLVALVEFTAVRASPPLSCFLARSARPRRCRASCRGRPRRRRRRTRSGWSGPCPRSGRWWRRPSSARRRSLS